MNKTIVITGANGFIGRYLIEFFNHKGYSVVALIHNAYKIAVPGVDYRQFDLDSFAGDVIPEGTEAIVHAAYIPYKKGNNSDSRNLKGTKRLLDIARRKKSENLFIYPLFQLQKMLYPIMERINTKLKNYLIRTQI